MEELTARANALLIELDDDLRASERELQMATAQYGADATTRFRAALEASRQDVAEAFRLRMTLDEEPAPEPQPASNPPAAAVPAASASPAPVPAEPTARQPRAAAPPASWTTTATRSARSAASTGLPLPATSARWR